MKPRRNVGSSTSGNSSRSSPGGLSGFTLLECMVYVGVLFVIFSLAIAAFIRTSDNSRHLTENSAAILRALRAGEQWRADVRAATAAPRSEEIAQGTRLHLPLTGGEVTYFFNTNSVWRAGAVPAATNLVLAGVKSSRMMGERRRGVTAWRWELELAAPQKTARVKPLFTFQAVAPGKATP